MVHKRYEKRGGKVFGPYYYESYRDGVHVRKRYIGNEEEYQRWKRKKEEKIKSNAEQKREEIKNKISAEHNVEQLRNKPKFKNKQYPAINFVKILIILLIILAIVIIVLSLVVLLNEIFKYSSKTGFAIAENVSGISSNLFLEAEETVSQNFNAEKADLSVKEPPSINGNPVSKNKNKRMEFKLEGNNLRLYFDLLNYSEFVENLVNLKQASQVSAETMNQENQATNNTNELDNNASETVSNITEINQTGEEIVQSDNETTTENLSKQISPAITGSAIENLGETEIETILDNSVIPAENFEIILNETASSALNNAEHSKNALEYKWGYRIKLKDLKFMAKIELTSNENISKYDDYSLRIGKRNILSFQDLAEQGYKITIESPSLEMPINFTIENQTILIGNMTANETLTNLTSINITETNITIINETQANITISNITETNVSETNITIVNETVQNITGISNVTQIEEEKNQGSEQAGGGSGETTLVQEPPATKTPSETKQEAKEEAKEEKQEEKTEKTEIKEETKAETKEETPVGTETTTEGSDSYITGAIIRFFRLTGRIIGRVIENLGTTNKTIEDIKYENTITVYIEKDFTNSSYKIGDIIELDPTLIIEISKAEHLDSNRNFISDIYDFVKNLDNNWSEVINANDYVRVTFNQNLTNKNDISLYAKTIDNSSAEISVLRQGDNIEIARFTNITSENWYKVYLTNLAEDESIDVFDLKVLNNAIKIDYIVDPNNITDISFISPTPPNATSTTNTSFIANVSIVTNASLAGSDDYLTELKWSFNNTNYTIYNNSLVLMMNFDNLSAFGEGVTNKTYDASNYSNNGTCVSMSAPGCNWTAGKYNKGISFDGSDDYVSVTVTQAKTSHSLWFKNSTATTWTFGAYNGSAFFLNGQAGTLSQYPINISGTSIKIGINYSGSQKFNGTIDEIRIWNRNLTANEIYQQYVSNLQKYNRTQWYLYVNQSKNASAGLTPGSYAYFASAKNVRGNQNMTDKRWIIITSGNVDTTAPNVTLIAPANGTTVALRRQYFIANLTDDMGLLNATLYIWNSTDSLTNQTNITLSGTRNSSNISVLLPLASDSYKWNYYVCDNNYNCSWNNTNFTIRFENSTNVSICRNLTQANTIYIQTANIADNAITGDCIIVANQNITYNCNGYYISSIQNFSGVYSNKLNTTVKNCNITMGSGGNTGAIGIEYASGANDGLIYNNSIYGEMRYGLYFNANNENVSNNYINCTSPIASTGMGIYNLGANSSFISNNIMSNLYYAIYTTGGNNSFYYNNITSNRSIALNIGTSYNLIYGNNVTTNNAPGTTTPAISITGTNNTLINDSGNMLSGSAAGISISGGNHTLISNTGYSVLYHGISLSSSNNNILTNNTGTSTSSYGIYIVSSSNNILNNNTGISNSSRALYIQASDNHNIINQIAIGYSINSVGIYIRNSYNLLFKDCINVTGFSSDISYDALAGSTNNSFVNCSYNISKETITSGNSLIRKWYYQAYVNDTSGNPIQGVNTSIFNNTDNYVDNLTTNASGFTPIYEIIDYINNGTFRNYQSLYSLNTSLANYNDNSHFLNASLENNRSDYFTLTVSLDSIYPIFSSYLDNNGSLIGSGTGEFNVTVINTNGTVWLSINGTNYTATNLSLNMYNVSVAGLLNGTYTYNWTAYGNGTNKNTNKSDNRIYVINNSILDTLSPNVTLISPANGTTVAVRRQYFIANLTDDYGLKNSTLYIWNSTNDIINQTNITLSGAINSSNISVLLPLASDSYKWNYYVCDNWTISNCAWNATNWTIRFENSTNVSICRNLTTANAVYTQTANIADNAITGDCIQIKDQNITYNCNGYYISSIQNFSGVYSNQYNTTIKNCNISMGGGSTVNTNTIGIELESGSNSSTLYNNTVNSINGYGILIKSHFNNITSNKFLSNTSSAVYVSGGLNNTMFLENATGLYGYYFDLNSNYNDIIDCDYLNGISKDIFVSNISAVNLINCSYNASKEDIDLTSSLTRKWYYRAYANNSEGAALYNVSVIGSYKLANSSALNLGFQKYYHFDNVSTIITDDSDVKYITKTAGWVADTNGYGATSLYVLNGPANVSLVWNISVYKTGEYRVYTIWTASANRGSNVPYTINSADGISTVTVSQKTNGLSWQLLGTYNFTEGNYYFVNISNNADGYVIADAIVLTQNSTPNLIEEYGVYDNLTAFASRRYNPSNNNYAFELNGVKSFLNGSFSNDTSPDLSFCSWIYPTSNPATWGTISSLGYGATKYGASLFRKSTTNLSLFIGSITEIIVPKSTSLNNWTHVCYSYVNSTKEVNVYVDGINVKKDTTSAGYLTYTDNRSFFGKRSDNTLFFNGSIDEIMIWNRSLSDSEFLSIYQTQYTNYFNLTTNSSGYTNITIIPEYVNLNGTKNYYTAYNVTAINMSVSLSHDVNISNGNNLTDFFTFSYLLYPIFSNYWDNNGSLVGSGTGLFNVTVINTNGTVWLSINGTNYTATNLSLNMYNVSVAGLLNGTYTYNWTAYGNGTNKNTNKSDNRIYVVNASIANTVPDTPAVSINSTDLSNKTKQDLNCFAYIYDSDNNTLNMSVVWYKNNATNLSVDYNNSYINGTLFNAVLNNGNTTKGENWSCGLRLYDGKGYSNWSNSSQLFILNTLPAVSLLTPPNNNVTNNRTPTFTWSGVDDDGDSLQYEINISLLATSTCSEADRYIAKETISTSTSYTVSNYMKCLSDNNDKYQWTVRAWDGEGYGNWNSSARNISIQSEVTISLPVAGVDFGLMNISKTDNTADDSPRPLSLRNDGNAMLNISVNFSNLFSSAANPSKYYQYKVRNLTTGCFIYENSTTSWANASTITGMIIHKLNFTSGYQTGCNNASIDILVEVPADEPNGTKSSTITFTSSLGEKY